MNVMNPVSPRTMHIAVSPNITSGLAIGCSCIRSCSRASASPAVPYSRARVS